MLNWDIPVLYDLRFQIWRKHLISQNEPRISWYTLGDTRQDIPDPPRAQLAPNLHNEENMDARPDPVEMEQAINKIPAAVGDASEEGLQGLYQPTVTLSCPSLYKGQLTPLSVAKDRANMFTPSELRLYQHAQDHRLLTRNILGYNCLFGDILG